MLFSRDKKKVLRVGGLYRLRATDYLGAVAGFVVVVFLTVDVLATGFFAVEVLAVVEVFVAVVFTAVLAVVVAAGFAVVAGAAILEAAGAGAGMIEVGSDTAGATAGTSTVPLILKTTGEFLAFEFTVTLLEKGPGL